MSHLPVIQAYIEQLSPGTAIEWREWFIQDCLNRWVGSDDEYLPPTEDERHTTSADFRRRVELLSEEEHWQLRDWYVAREDLVWDSLLQEEQMPPGVAGMATQALADFLEGRFILRLGRFAPTSDGSSQSTDSVPAEEEPAPPRPPMHFGDYTFAFTHGFWPSAQDKAPIDYFTVGRFAPFRPLDQPQFNRDRPYPRRAGSLWTLDIGYLHRAIAIEHQDRLIWFWVCNLNEYFGFPDSTNS